MPLSSLQRDILRLLAAHRDPESYVAGSAPLTRISTRYSGDIDIFNDREERTGQAAKEDIALLEGKGYAVKWLRPGPGVYSAVVEQGELATKLEWVSDSDFRFFPVVRDDDFGYVLHPVDLATNKVGAAYGRQEPRDIVDLLDFHDRLLPLGAMIWAAAGKAIGFTPEGIINEIRRNARYVEADFRRIYSDPPIDPAATMIRLRKLLDEAAAFVARMPTEKVGLVFLEADRVVQPDPTLLDRYETHAGMRRGHWPSSREIASAMFEFYNPRPDTRKP